jgi:hypothetical protein
MCKYPVFSYLAVFTVVVWCSLLSSMAALAQNDQSESMTVIIKPGPPPGNVVVSIADVSAGESKGTLVFPVSLSEVSKHVVTITYQLGDATAEAGSDYEASAGALTIQAGSQSAEIPVTILDDALNEADETFVVELTEVANAAMERSQATGTIRDNDELPTLSISDAAAEELSETMTMSFTVTLSPPSGREVSVDFTTVDDTAVAGADYTATQGTLTIPAGTTEVTLDVAITLDEERTEGDEHFFVTLQNPRQAELENVQGQGTIQNTAGSLINRALGRPLPEPSTLLLVALGLAGIGLLATRKPR